MPFSSNNSSITSSRPLFQTSSNQRRISFLFSSDMRGISDVGQVESPVNYVHDNVGEETLSKLREWFNLSYGGKLPGCHLDARIPHVPRCVERTCLKLISLVLRIRHGPVAGISRRRIRTLQGAVDQEFHTRNSNVITRSCADRDCRSACDAGPVSGIGDRNSWRSGVAATSATASEVDAVHRARTPREVVKNSVRRDFQVNGIRNAGREIRRRTWVGRIEHSDPAATEIREEVLADKVQRKLSCLRVIKSATRDRTIHPCVCIKEDRIRETQVRRRAGTFADGPTII